MIVENIYMVRGGAIGENFTIQFLVSIVAFAVCVVDWRLKHRKDYFWIFLTGTIIWTLVELTLQLTGVRVMGTKYLFGNPIPLAVSLVLQGMAEGAAIAICGVCLGDLVMAKSSRKMGIIALAVLLAILVIVTLAQALPAPDIGGDVPSRRDVFALGSVLFISAFSAGGLLWLWRTDRAARVRVLWMFLMITIVGCIWTLAEVLANTRWVEVGTLGDLTRAPPAVEFVVEFVWGVVVEASLLLIPFFAIPHILDRIKSKET